MGILSLAATFDGLDGALRNLDDVASRVDKASGNVMLKLAERVKDQAIAEITGHSRSAPGGPPASRTGNLVDSIVAKLISETASEVVVNADYAKHVELGTRKMLAHPFMRLAIAIVVPEFLNMPLGAQMLFVDLFEKANTHKSDSGFMGAIPASILK